MLRCKRTIHSLLETSCSGINICIREVVTVRLDWNVSKYSMFDGCLWKLRWNSECRKSRENLITWVTLKLQKELEISYLDRTFFFVINREHGGCNTTFWQVNNQSVRNVLLFVRDFKHLALSQIRCGAGDVMGMSTERSCQRALVGCDSRVHACVTVKPRVV